LLARTKIRASKEEEKEMKIFRKQLAAVLIAVPALFAQTDAVFGPSFLPNPFRIQSTIPSNGDLNPYGVAFVPNIFPSGGMLNPGDILVSNFNNSMNQQGTGTTIVRIPPAPPAPPAPLVTFFTATPAQMGLTTALNILHAGFVLVGSFPGPGGVCTDALPGGILVIDSKGNFVSEISGNNINGPWDMTVNDMGSTVQAFISNGLDGTVIRLDLNVTATSVSVKDSVVIATGYQHECDIVTFVDAPTGLVYNPVTDTLFVASTVDNAVYAVPDAGHASSSVVKGTVIYQDAKHLHGALAMTMAPNGHLLVSNNDAMQINPDPNQPSEIVEFTTNGEFVKEVSVDIAEGGSFGLSTRVTGLNQAQLAAVDDNQNILIIWTLPII
jgi:hypothetical protein